MFSYITSEARVRRTSLRPTLDDDAPRALVVVLRSVYSTTGRPSIPGRNCCARCCARSTASQRTAPDGGARLQHSVPVVVGVSPTTRCGTRRRLPRTATDARWRHRRRVLRRGPGGDQADGRSPTSTSRLTGRPEAWASHKASNRRGVRRGRPMIPESDRELHGTTRRNDTINRRRTPTPAHKKAVGREAKLGYLAHLLTENRHGSSSTRPSPTRPARLNATPRSRCWASCR